MDRGNTVERFEKLIEQGMDNALVRYTLGNALFKQEELDAAIDHLREAVRFDPEYTVAWKVLGQALAGSGREAEAMEVFREAIELAERKGDMQVAKETRVFLKRLERARSRG